MYIRQFEVYIPHFELYNLHFKVWKLKKKIYIYLCGTSTLPNKFTHYSNLKRKTSTFLKMFKHIKIDDDNQATTFCDFTRINEDDGR